MLRAMLQQMLEDRFKLAVHRSTKDVPGYSLSAGKSGPRFKQTNPDEPHPSGIAHPEGGVTVPEVRDGQTGGLLWVLDVVAGVVLVGVGRAAGAERDRTHGRVRFLVSDTGCYRTRRRPIQGLPCLPLLKSLG